ncbi:MAG: pentapeptide repeat-containing protein [Acidobacteriota bacterium]|nr:pentapeptide repeat-containing protein [Acidobacteriota bacterium]
MATFLILLTSFAVAAGGIIQNSQAPPEKRTVLGMTAVGSVLILLACSGFVASVAKERADAKVREIEQLRDQMNLAASRAREADFSLSDFSRSRFDRGNFTLTYFPEALFKDAGFRDARFDGANFEGAAFPGAHFKGADFRGADLRGIIVDERTLFPAESNLPPNPAAAAGAASQRR